MTTHCTHPDLKIEATADTCHDGGRVLRLQCRCTECDRLVEFTGLPHHGSQTAQSGRPLVHMGGRAVALPFRFSGSLMG